MTEAAGAAASPWSEPALAAAILVLDPHGIGGVALRARQPVRSATPAWSALLRAPPPRRGALPPATAPGGRRAPAGAASTSRRRSPPVVRSSSAGAACRCGWRRRRRRHGGTAIRRHGCAPGGAALDAAGVVVLERDGITPCSPARFGIVALDEGIEDERPPGVLLDRLAIHLALDGRGTGGTLPDMEDIRAARIALPLVTAGETVVRALREAAMALGIASLRAPLLALRVARAAAALAGRRAVEDVDTVGGGVLRPGVAGDDAAGGGDGPGGAAAAATGRGAAGCGPGGSEHRRRPAAGRRRGRGGGPGGAAGGCAGTPAGGPRLPHSAGGAGGAEGRRAARPSRRRAARRSARRRPPRRRGDAWGSRTRQRLRGGAGARVAVRRDHFRVKRFKRRTETTTVFAVDASGSSALHRMAEAKGAVELLLADCYVRRDRVALLAFRCGDAVLVLPPTRSLARAKRCLAAMVGGGGTPLAAGIAAATSLADGVSRKGQTAVLVLLTMAGRTVAPRRHRRAGEGDERPMDAARLVRTASGPPFSSIPVRSRRRLPGGSRTPWPHSTCHCHTRTRGCCRGSCGRPRPRAPPRGVASGRLYVRGPRGEWRPRVPARRGHRCKRRRSIGP